MFHHAIDGRHLAFALPITLTPYAGARPCSARCTFCSETLVPRGRGALAAQLRPGNAWLAGFARALDALAGVPLGVSLSGLEATDDLAWLEDVLGTLERHAARPDGRGVLEERVLYTNAANLAPAARRLAAFDLTRAEVSRHHDDAARNQTIMRFRPGIAVAGADGFAAAVRAAREHVAVRLVCVVQAAGVATLADMERYLAFARALGVRDVVFRELARLDGDDYAPNRTLRVLQEERVAMDALVAAARAATGWTEVGAKEGYYYANVRFRHRSGADVTLEASDYRVLRARHASGVVHKLVYHGNGNLCGGWDPERDVLLRPREA